MNPRHAIVIASDGQAKLRAAGVGPSALARALAISRQFASRILNRGVVPGRAHLATIERVLGIPVSAWSLRAAPEPQAAAPSGLGDTAASVTWKSQGQAALLLCAHPTWESDPPRLWSTTPAAVATACGVLEVEVAAWARGDRTPTAAQQRALASSVYLPAEWWSLPPPASAAEGHALALFMGLRGPTPEEREYFYAQHGITRDSWTQPARAAS